MNSETVSIEDKYLFTTAEDSVKAKDWAAGSSTQMESDEVIIKRVGRTYVGDVCRVSFPPALHKIIDEPIVNAMDHLVNTLGSSNPVTCVRVSLDATGRVSIYNNGPGVEVAVHKVATDVLKETTYVPTFVFGMMFQGSNNKSRQDSIVGGTNGLGVKLSNCFSNEFIVETTDGVRGLHFRQRWLNKKTITEAPTIKPISEVPAALRVSHTRLTFTPDYVGQFGYSAYTPALHETLTDLIRARVFFAAAYAQYTATRPIDIWFNDEKVPVKTVADIARIVFPGTPVFSTVITPAPSTATAYTYPWEVVAVVTNTCVLSSVTNVNGIVVRDGKHVDHVKNKIAAAIKTQMTKALQDSKMTIGPKFVADNIVIMINSKIPNAGWTGQRKDVLAVDIRKLAAYKLPPAFTADITKSVSTLLNSKLVGKKTRTTGTGDAKHTRAGKWGSRSYDDRKKNSLLLGEGDSALSQITIGISTVLGREHHGTISLGGVIMNARKNCIDVKVGDVVHTRPSAAFLRNTFIAGMIEATGLSLDSKYDPKSPTYAAEMRALHYGNVIACVDQDLDGKGQILGLILNLFEMYWPNLITAGYVKWFATPIIRAYPKSGGKVVAFYSLREKDDWARDNDESKYDLKYYKGLGTHDRKETIDMFRGFREHVYTYYRDERSAALFEIYFGRSPALRKAQMTAPPTVLSDSILREQARSRRISCSHHLEVETDAYQRDNLDRKLDNAVDGQNQAGRKILDGLTKALGGKKSLRVSQLAGYVSEHENYHHGEAGLGDSITGRGFVGVGGKQIPIIVPKSYFGSRMGGGPADAAQARYIYATLNKAIVRMIFPREDYFMLEFNFDEGHRGEPKYFAPIVPMAVLESTKIPSNAWSLTTWARDVYKVIENVQRLIRIGDRAPLIGMPAARYAGASFRWTGEFKTIRGVPHSFGRYSYIAETNSIVIEELPLRVWTNNYLADLKKKITRDRTIVACEAADLDGANESNDLRIKITIPLNPGAMELLDDMGDSVFTDGVEEYFMLRDSMQTNINFMCIDGSVRGFDTYDEVIYYWFVERKRYYVMRMNRRRIMNKLRLVHIDNIIRFVGEAAEMKLASRRLADMNAMLSSRGYTRINGGLLAAPKFTRNDDLERDILHGDGADYKYLLKLGDIKRSVEALEKYHVTRNEILAECDEITRDTTSGRFPGARLWDQELDDLVPLLRAGFASSWEYADATKFNY